MQNRCWATSPLLNLHCAQEMWASRRVLEPRRTAGTLVAIDEGQAAITNLAPGLNHVVQHLRRVLDRVLKIPVPGE